MIYSTRGVVLHQINYGESSVITKIYTELFGLRSYIINGVRSKKAKIKSNILQPMSVLDMGVYNRDNHNLQRIKYANAVNPNSPIGLNVVKGSIAIFIAEVLYRSIQEEEPNRNLFNFLLNFINDLENEKGSVANYHLSFMVDLAGYLGFYPSVSSSGTHGYFDKREGVFCKDIPVHGDWMDIESSKFLRDFIVETAPTLANIKMTSVQRNDLIQHLIAYYNLHLNTRFEIKSHSILKTVME